jgi:pyruvate dehydrogenase E1 component alpha subunit
MAFGERYLGRSSVVLNFFGDGAANKGELHEAMNLASVWRLPVVFLCENNFYASTTNIALTMSVPRVSDRAAAYSMPGALVDGNDVAAVHAAAVEAVARARAGDGPTLVECLTYRRGGHKRAEAADYRPRSEVDRWLALDPIPRFIERLLREGVTSDDEVDRLEREATDAVDEAATEALAAPEASPA